MVVSVAIGAALVLVENVELVLAGSDEALADVPAAHLDLKKNI